MNSKQTPENLTENVVLDATNTDETIEVEPPKAKRQARTPRQPRQAKTKSGKAKGYVENIAGLFELARTARPDVIALPTDAEVRGMFTPLLSICERHGWLPEGEVSLDGQDIITAIVVGYMYMTRVRLSIPTATAQRVQDYASGYDNHLSEDNPDVDSVAKEKIQTLLAMDVAGRMNQV